MKNIKKVLGIALVLLLGIGLVSCKKDDKPTGLTDKDVIEAAHRQLSLGMSEDDMKDVKNDFELVVEMNISGNKVNVSWESSKKEIVKIDGDKAIVKLQDEETNVKLTANLTFKEEKRTKEFDITVAKRMDYDFEAENISDLLSNKDNKDKTIKIKNEVVVIGVGGGGYFIADNTGAIGVYANSGTPAGIEVGDRGTFIGTLDVAFGTTPQFKVESANFYKEDEKMPMEDILKLAKERTVEDQVKAKNEEWENAFGFYKFKAKLVVKTTGGNTNPYITSMDGESELVHYYKIDGHEKFIAIANSGLTDEGVDIYAFINDYHSGDKVYRMGITHIDVDLDDEAIVDIAKTDIETSIENTPHYISGNVDLVKKTKTDLGATIKWSFADDVNNDLIDLSTGKLADKIEGIKTINLNAEITLNDVKETVEVELLVGEPLVSKSITEIKDAKLNSYITLKGKVISKLEGNFTNYYFVEGEEKVQIFRLSKEDIEKLTPILGTEKEAIITAKVSEYRGNRQLTSDYLKVEVE